MSRVPMIAPKPPRGYRLLKAGEKPSLPKGDVCFALTWMGTDASFHFIEGSDLWMRRITSKRKGAK